MAGRAGPQLGAGLPFPGLGEAAGLGQLGRHLPVLDQHGKGPAGAHRAQLRQVANQEDLGPRVAGLGGRGGRGRRCRPGGPRPPRSRSPGFSCQRPTSASSSAARSQDRAGQPAAGRLAGQGPQPGGLGQPGGFPVGLGQPLGRVLGGDAELVGQVGRGRRRGGQALHAARPRARPPRRPAVPPGRLSSPYRPGRPKVDRPVPRWLSAPPPRPGRRPWRRSRPGRGCSQTWATVP